VGVFAVCALSTWLELDVFREGSHFFQRFERGLAVSPLRVLEHTIQTGTRVAFAPDPSIFTSTWIDPGPILTRLREMSFLLPGLSLSFTDRREHRWREPGGLVSYVESKTRYDVARPRIFTANQTIGTILVEAAGRWGPRPWTSVESFANVERTTDGGTHVRGFLLGLVAGLKAVANDACVGRTTKQIEATVVSGLTAVVSVRLNDPSFGEPTKTRLVTPEAEAAVKACVAEAFAQFLRDERDLLARLISTL
jgi:DNA gyrase subunit B